MQTQGRGNEKRVYDQLMGLAKLQICAMPHL
jgi:hypothetical protein